MLCVVASSCSVSPSFDDNLCLSQAVEDFPVQQFVSELGIETLDIAVLPRVLRLDVGVPAGGAQKFLRATSFRMSLSSVRSETAFLSRSFSF